MASVQSQLALSFAKQVKYHSVNMDFRVKTAKSYTAKAQNPSEGTEQCSNNFGQVCFADRSRTGINQSEAMPWICATV